MIGTIRFGFRGGVAEAVLGHDGCWGCCAVPCLVHPLDILYSPNWDGLPTGRRYLEEVARWLRGAVILGADRPIPGMVRPSNPGVRADLFERPCHDPMVYSTRQSNRLTYHAAADMCRVGRVTIGLWVETGAWPMPRRVGAASATFSLSEVEGWLATGAWPAGAHFHSPPAVRTRS
jgi:predicted DNA-binding transcriptional regulator AlpA